VACASWHVPRQRGHWPGIHRRHERRDHRRRGAYGLAALAVRLFANIRAVTEAG
jgi:hypothetical protein